MLELEALEVIQHTLAQRWLVVKKEGTWTSGQSSPVHSSIAGCVDALVPRELNPQGACHFWEGLNCCVVVVLFSSDLLTFGLRKFDGKFVRVCSVSAQGHPL